LLKLFSFNQNAVSIIGKNLFNHMKVSNFSQNIVLIKIKSPLTHMINMLCTFNTVLTNSNVKIITFT